MGGPWEKYKAPEKKSGPWAKYQEPAAPEAPAAQPAADGLADWQRPENLKNVQTHNGFESVQRYDGGVWYGPKQGNQGDPGWFDAEGNRLPMDPTGDSPFLKKAAAVSQTFARPFERTIEGTGQLINRILGNKQQVQDYQAQINANEQDFKDNAYHGRGSGVLEFTGAVMQPIPGLRGVPGATLTRKMIQGGTVGGLTAGLQPVYGDGENFGSQKTIQTLTGVTLGTAAPAIADKVVAPLAKRAVGAVNRLKEKIAPEYKALAELQERYGVDLSIGDITQSPGLKKTEVALENVPLSGVAKFRAKGQEQVKAAADRFLGQLQDELKAAGYKGLPELEAAAAAGNKRAIRTLELVRVAQNDPDKVIQASGSMKLFDAKQQAGKLYDEVEALAANNGRWQRPSVETKKVLEETLKEQGQALSPNQQVSSKAQELLDRLNDKNVRVDFGTLRKLRSDLGTQVQELGQKGDLQSAALLGRVRDAVEADMKNLATNSGNPKLVEAWKKADAFYAKQVVPLQTREMAKMMDSAAPDEIFSAFIKAGRGDRAANFVANLDEKGQAALRAKLVEEAVKNATTAEANGKAAFFSPQKFVSYLNKFEDPASSIFKGEAKWKLDGLKKLMSHATRFGQYAENPPTGNRMATLATGGALGAGVTVNPYLGGGGWLTAAGVGRLLTSKLGKNLLLRASDVQVGSKAMDQIEKEISKAIGTKATPSNVTPLVPRPAVPAAAEALPPDQNN